MFKMCTKSFFIRMSKDKNSDKPKCANCNGEHTSNSRDCPKHLINTRNFKNPSPNNPITNNFTWGQQNNRSAPNTNTNNNLPKALQETLNQTMQSIMSEFAKAMQAQVLNMLKNFNPQSNGG